MPKRGAPPLQGELIQGTLDVLVLRTLALGPAHGHTIAHVIEHRSEDVLQVEHGSLYPALHRLDAHLAHEMDDNLARGMTPDHARAAAHRKLGNATRIREEIYTMNSLGFVE